MAGVKLSDKIVRDLVAPASGNRITYDTEIKGFGVRITAGGARSFILNYYVAGRERRLTIGAYPAWSVAAARDEAKRLRREIDTGSDPLGLREAARSAPTVTELCDRYLEEHAPKKRTAAGDRSMIERDIRPRLGNRRVASITFADVDALHREVTKRGRYTANRVIGLLSKMFALSIRWEMRADNPARGIERNHEERRVRYLSGDELQRLSGALAVHPNQAAANAIRLLLLTGARRNEVLGATWAELDLEGGVWTKPSSSTKQRREHRVPLSAPARQLLALMKEAAGGQPSRFVFPAKLGQGPTIKIKNAWAAIRKAANLEGVRLHDLRHSFASILVSSGASLPLIGSLLGHSNPSTTMRYAHLFDDPQRAAVERVAAAVMGNAEGGEVVPIRGARR